MTYTVDSGTSHHYQNDNPRRPYLSSSAFSTYTAGSPDYGFCVGPWTLEDRRITCQKGRPALLPRHYGFTDTVYYPMTPATTPPGTTTLRDLPPRLRRTPRAPEPSHPQRQELNTVFSEAAVRDDTKDTPESST